jgi:hypothetical protein
MISNLENTTLLKTNQARSLDSNSTRKAQAQDITVIKIPIYRGGPVSSGDTLNPQCAKLDGDCYVFHTQSRFE